MGTGFQNTIYDILLLFNFINIDNQELAILIGINAKKAEKEVA